MPTIHEVANFLWEIADEILRDDFKRSKYPDVILPFVVLRRLDCVLAPTKDAVLARRKKLAGMGLEPEQMDGQLRKASGYAFHNTSKFDFNRLLDDPANIGKNIVAYINGFSENVRDIVDNFSLRHNIDILDAKNLLFLMVGPEDGQPEGCAASRPAQQPRHGLRLRGTDSALQRAGQRESR